MIGRTFSHYKILEKLGQGGMGEVWLAHDSSLDRKVALKFLSPLLEGDSVARKRLLREAKSAAALDHPYICSIHEVGEFEGKVFIAMEYVQGITLRDKLKDGALPLAAALDIASEVAQALTKAHKEGIVHRDLKPSNIMLSADHVKVVDFGLAKRIPTSDSETAQQTIGEITGRGTTLGTLRYMSPEQIRNRQIDARSDMFSFGVVLYEILSGVHPFAKETEFETMHAILNESPAPIESHRPEVPLALRRVISRMLAKNPDQRYASFHDVWQELDELRTEIRPRPGTLALWPVVRRPQVAIPLLVAILAVSGAFYFYARRAAQVRWAREEAIPEIIQLAATDNYSAAFALARQAEVYIPGDPKIAQLLPEVSVEVAIETEPPGANVYIKDYEAVSPDWDFRGVSPVDRIRVSRGYKRIKIEKAGYAPVEGALMTNALSRLKVSLSEQASVPEEMVRVSGGSVTGWITGIDPIEEVQLAGFLMDRFEVRNKDFKKFLDRGGYQNKAYWKQPFVRDGRVLAWDEAMSQFRDTTGRPGPSTWELGDYPKEQDNFPVTGVSWFEAAAYAEFVGKSLPTVYHWIDAADTETGKYVFPFSRFGGNGPIEVGRSGALHPFGTYDMAGNVREWCWNEDRGARYILGGAWNDPNYMFNFAQVRSPWDRSPANGFRCVRYQDPAALPQAATGRIELLTRDYSKEQPASQAIFQVYKQQFEYDRIPLKATAEPTDTSNEDWTKQKITFDAAYAGDRVIAYLFLPKKSKSPFQVVVLFPGSGAISEKTIQQDTPLFDFFLKSGRAVLFPIYKGTYERNDGLNSTWPNPTHRYSEYVIKWVKDLRRSIDYLESRKDIDVNKLAYAGFSWGGRMGAIIPAVEKRIKVSVLASGGLASGRAQPDVDQINFVPHVTIPVLMLNGKFDSIEPVESAQIPMFKLLGTPEASKRQIIYESGHLTPRNETIKETLDWLDRYLGPVK